MWARVIHRPELRNCRPMPGICLPDNVETAITMAYIARVLGYDSRAAMGAVTAWGPAHPLSPHGWCEVRVDSGWKMIDCSMQNGHPDANLFFVGRNRYPYRLRCDKTYALNINNGKVSWR